MLCAKWVVVWKSLNFLVCFSSWSECVRWPSTDEDSPFRFSFTFLFSHWPQNSLTLLLTCWVNCLPMSWRQERPKHVPVQKTERLPSDSIRRQEETMAVCFSRHAFQWKEGERLPACCLNLRQTVSVWVTGLPTAIVTAHLAGVMARFSIFPVCLSCVLSILCLNNKTLFILMQNPPELYRWRLPTAKVV